MKAVVIEVFGGRDQLKIVERPVPDPKPGEVQIRIKAAGVNPVDWKIRVGLLKDVMPHVFPIILGWDAAGVVTAVGPQVDRLTVGDEVYAYCRKDTVQDGAYAEFIVLPENNIALKPKNVSFEEAATIPLAALTAYQSLIDAAHLKSGERIVIHAAAGGVGGFAVQIAHGLGAYVIGTASHQNHAYVRSLGAEEVIDYTQHDVSQTVKSLYPEGVDVVYDCVGGQPLEQARLLIKPEGRIVTIVDPAQAQILQDQGLNAQFVFVAPHAQQLLELTRMVEAGQLRTEVSARLPLEEVVKAHELIETHHTKGKIVLTVA
ncbi:MAG: NADP-dependent oxidoreductase [Nitrospirae bacterium]|nr:NADP-dependent oxidoreductase [Nitrospirota bacterium]